MRAGVTSSIIAHAALLVIALVGFGSAKPIEPERVESIAVDLVQDSDITNIRRGSEKSTIVETKTPTVVKAETPAVLAKTAGNTDQDQVKPEETQKATPAPVVNTAPKPSPPVPEPPKDAEPPPSPDPAPQPGATPQTTPAADPAPSPKETQAPKEVAAETPADTSVSQPAPVPLTRPAELQQAPVKAPPTKTKMADAKSQTKPSKPKTDTAKAASESTHEAELTALLQNLEKSRGATTGEGGDEPTLGKTSGKSATLTQNAMDALMAQIKSCFYLAPNMIDSQDSAHLVFSLDSAGNVTGDPTIDAQSDTVTGRALGEAAKRAVLKCGPYLMAVGQDIGATFNAQQML